ncbi:MAG: hypothetical protein ACYC26_09490 [Phycisphaerales bacterium]
MTRTVLQITNQKSQIKNQGSVLILVVTVLVLMLLIGIAYVQTARTDRLSTAGVENNIDQVVNAEVARLLTTLKDDLVDSSSGQFLNDSGSREPYDYPVTGTPWGTLDDAWLANIGVNSSTQWPHITNIAGQFINASGALVSLATESDTNVTAAQYSTSTTWPNADADDDGITDSKYTNSAVQWISGVRYVTAIRVIDLSALVNINTALAETDASAAYDATTNAPRWWYPSELDFNFFVGDTSPSTYGGGSEVKKMLAYRMGLTPGSATLPTPWVGSGAESRGNFWYNGVRYDFKNPTSPYSGYKSLGIAEELKLRYRNGLNNPDSKGTMLNTYMPIFIRENPGTAEADFTATTFGLGGNIAGYLGNEPRHQMTTVSAASIITAKTTNSAARTLAINLNPPETDANIQKAVEEIYTGATIQPVPAGGYADAKQFAAQFAAAAHDYRDNDNTVTKVSDGTTDRLGFEKLPFIAEVYVQAKYEVTSVAAVVPATDPVTYNVDWKQTGDVGYAIEIRNPFKQEIKLTDIRLFVGGSNWGTLDGLSGQPTLAANGVIVLYRDSAGKADANDDVGKLISDGAKGISQNWSNSGGASPSAITVELQVPVSGGGTWNYVKYASVQLPATYNQTGLATLPAVGDKGWMQDNSQGNGNGLNVMFVSPKSAAGTHKVVETSQLQPDQPYMTSMKLGDSSKSGATDVLDAGTPQQIVWRDDSGDVFWQAGEVAQMIVVPCTADKTFAEAWNERSKVTDWMLDFDSTTLVGTNNLALPHAAVLMNRLTTLSPAKDGVDSDGQNGIDDNAEQVVPGRINLNTATREMLMRTLPIPDATVRGNIVDAIIAYRDMPTGNRPSGVRTSKGIASLGELMLPATGAGKVRDILGADGASNYQMGVSNTAIDFTPAAGTDDGITDDREEKAMVLRWLSQVCTTRSDVFAAYIYIRGYDNGTFDTDHLAEVARVLVILDRSGIVDKDGTPKVIGYVRYK